MENKNCERLGDKIYELRKQKNLTQHELAKKVRVTRQTVSKWEANLIQPKADKIERIGKVLEADLEYLMSQNSGTNIIDENSIESSVVASDIVQNDQEESITDQYNNTDNKKLSKGIKKILIITITVITILLLLGISLIIISHNMTPSERNGSFDNGVKSTTWNFSMENFGLIILSVGLVIGGIMGLVLVVYGVKKQKNY